MKDISLTIKACFGKISNNCPSISLDTGLCEREHGCICHKYAEIISLVKEMVPEKYRKSTIFDFDGWVRDSEGKKISQAFNPQKVNQIRSDLWQYMYQGDYKDYAHKKNMSRNELNHISKLDARFSRGDNIVIHGRSQSISDIKESYKKVTKRKPMGKTLLGSVVLVDAIYRRLSPNNKARTYDRVSFLQLKQILKSNSEEKDDLVDSDWLLIDDLSPIDSSSKSAEWTKEVLDSFLIERLENKKPTIFICDFNIEEVPLSSQVGSGFDKICRKNETTIVEV